MFDKILEDKTHGSQHILIKSLEECSRFLMKYPNRSSEVFNFLNKLQETFPDMEMIQRFDLEFANSSSSKLMRLIEMTLNHVLTENEWLEREIMPLIKNSRGVLTISYSQTVKSVLEKVKVKNIYVMKSEPGLEGVKFYEELITSGEKHLIEDNEAEWLMKRHKVTSVLLGCDKFHTRLGFVNKRGSKDIVLYASENNIPVYVIGSSWKKVDQDIQFLSLDEKSRETLEVIPLRENVKIIYPTIE